MQWHVFANTIMPPPEDIWKPGSEPLLEDQQQFLVGSRSVVILVGK
jgi:isoamylase